MFNQNVTNVLSQVNGITNTAILKFPNTIINSPAGDIIVNINMEALDEDKFEDMGIYNLSEFLSTFKLFDDSREVSIVGNMVSVFDGGTSLQYITTPINLLEEFNKDASIFSKTESVPTVAEFQLTPEDVRKLKQASGVFKDLTEVQFTSKDGDITIELTASNKFNAKSNNYSVSKTADTSREFQIKVPVENFNVLPGSTYTCVVKYNSAKDAYRIMFNSEELQDFKVLMAIKK